MELQTRSRAVWEQMPDEVWATILSCLKPEQEEGLHHYHQSWFLSLPIVCKKFHSVFEGNPHLCPNLRLHNQRTSQHFAQLLTWVRGRASHLTHLAAYCGIPCLEAVLAVMQPQSCLDTICVEAPSMHTLSHLAAFKTLTQCVLLTPPSLLSLRAMEALPDLTTIKLVQAHVADIEALAHLTALHFHSSQTVCKHSFRSATSLLSLDLKHASIDRFHDHGVLACTRLLSFKCQESSMEAYVRFYSLAVHSAGPLMSPKNLVHLTALTRLMLCGAVMPI